MWLPPCLPIPCHQEQQPRENRCSGLFKQPGGQERVLVLGIQVGKLRQKSSSINCPNMGGFGMCGSGKSAVQDMWPPMPPAGGAELVVSQQCREAQGSGESPL